jgi:hypothetical protein
MSDTDTLPLDFPGQETEHTAPFDGFRLNLLSKRFMQHFHRYLNGSGHPDHPIYNELVSFVNREEAKKDQAFRARQFVVHITGTAFLDSPARNMKVCVCFHILSKHLIMQCLDSICEILCK